MDLDALMARYSEGVTEAQKREAMQQALAAAGFAMLGANTGGGWQGAARALGRGGLLGMGAYNQALGDAAQAPVQQLDVYSKFAQMKAQEQKARESEEAKRSSADFSQQLSSVFGAGPQLGNMGPGGPTPANAQRVAPPSQIEKYRQAAAMYAARGDTEGAKRLADIADRMEGEYSTNPQIGMGPNGAQFAQFSNKGGMRTVEGFAPPPDMQILNLGGKQVAIDKRATAPGAEFGVTMDPAQRDASARGWAGIGLDRERLNYQQSADRTMTGQKAGELVSGLRKEYNALQPVQNYRAALPVVESAKNAPDTPAGDLDLIYAVGKALDPNSVVREGELNLVIKSGSPIQRFAGFAQYIGAGKGRLPSAQRAELIQMLNGRIAQLKAAHDSAAAPYIKQAQHLGLPMDQIFQEEKKTSGTTQSSGPSSGTIVDGYRFRGGDPNDQTNWERVK